MDKLTAVSTRLDSEFDLPGGQYFELKLTEDGLIRLAILEESGGCTVQDWAIDSILLPRELPEGFEFNTKTETLKAAAPAAVKYMAEEV